MVHHCFSIPLRSDSHQKGGAACSDGAALPRLCVYSSFRCKHPIMLTPLTKVPAQQRRVANRRWASAEFPDKWSQGRGAGRGAGPLQPRQTKGGKRQDQIWFLFGRVPGGAESPEILRSSITAATTHCPVTSLKREKPLPLR